ncbi:hypothetical protein DMC61_40055 [Amycolatopsis sp. WAC 04169]|nr:hypothetical protein DMC61_40055 [Amycolatopsis sp. WAC 04169]
MFLNDSSGRFGESFSRLRRVGIGGDGASVATVFGCEVKGAGQVGIGGGDGAVGRDVERSSAVRKGEFDTESGTGDGCEVMVGGRGEVACQEVEPGIGAPARDGWRELAQGLDELVGPVGDALYVYAG